MGKFLPPSINQSGVREASFVQKASLLFYSIIIAFCIALSFSVLFCWGLQRSLAHAWYYCTCPDDIYGSTCLNPCPSVCPSVLLEGIEVESCILLSLSLLVVQSN